MSKNKTPFEFFIYNTTRIKSKICYHECGRKFNDSEYQHNILEINVSLRNYLRKEVKMRDR